MFDDLDFSDYVTIKITKVKDSTGPAYWQMDIDGSDGEIGGGTAPTFYGVVDMAIEMARERNDIDDPEWSRFDANGNNE